MVDHTAMSDNLTERARRNARGHDPGFNPSSLLIELADRIDNLQEMLDMTGFREEAEYE